MVPRYQPDLPVTVKMRTDWKLLCSFFKRSWGFDDYPVYACPWVAHALPPPFPWQAFIIHWPGMHAGGNSASDAVENLRNKFDSSKQENKPPRPGQYRPTKVTFAPRDSILRYEGMQMEFVENILRLPWVFISDESSLMDFDSEGTTPKEYVERIRDHYGVDVSDISGGKLVDIFDRIAANRAQGTIDRTRGNK